MRKDPFKDPFFTDPDYMDKQMAKYKKERYKMMALIVISMLFFYFLIDFIFIGISRDINNCGGVAKCMGGFVKDFKEASE